MAVIDVHCHTTVAGYIAELRRIAAGLTEKAGAAGELFQQQAFADDPQMTGALSERIALLDEAGIDTQILSSANPISRFVDDPSQSAAMAQLINGEFSAACARHPGRYRFFVTFPLPHVAAAIDEFHRAAKLPGFAGVMINTNPGIPLNDPSLEDLYTELDRARALLFIHPSRMDCAGRYDRIGMQMTLGWPGEDTLAVMELVLAGVLDRYPGITVITPHLSGTALYLMGRIDHGYDTLSPARRQAAEPPSAYYKRMYHDSVTDWRPALELARTVVGADHIVRAPISPSGTVTASASRSMCSTASAGRRRSWSWCGVATWSGCCANASGEVRGEVTRA